MTEAVIVLAVCLLASFWTLFLVVRMLNDERRNAEQQWAKERDKLLERIQRPERIPQVEPLVPLEIPEAEPNEWAKVGQILDISDTYGMTDEDG